MNKSTTAQRLNEIMSERNLKQADILRLTVPYCNKYGVKMNKSDISQYCSGKVEPNQNKLFVLSAALNVNEAWLMGFDVPMVKNSCKECNQSQNETEAFSGILSTLGWNCEVFKSGAEIKFILSNGTTSFEASADDYYSLLDATSAYVRKGLQKLFLKSSTALFEKPLLNAAHERTDIAVTNEMRSHDDDIMDDENF